MGREGGEIGVGGEDGGDVERGYGHGGGGPGQCEEERAGEDEEGRVNSGNHHPLASGRRLLRQRWSSGLRGKPNLTGLKWD